MIYTKRDLEIAYLLGHLFYLPESIDEISEKLANPVLRERIDKTIALINSFKDTKIIIDKSEGKLEKLRALAKDTNTSDEFIDKLKSLEKFCSYKQKIVIYDDCSEFAVYFQVILKDEYYITEVISYSPRGKIILDGALVFRPNVNTWGIHT